MTVQFTVTGATKRQLDERIKETLRRFMDHPEPKTDLLSVNVRPAHHTFSDPVPVQWEADVEVRV